MLQIKHATAIFVLIFCTGLFMHSAFAAEETPPPATEEPPHTPAAETESPLLEIETRNWISEALSSEKPDDYYYRLLNDSTPEELEALIEAEANQTPPVERSAALEIKYQDRLLTLAGLLTLTQEQREHIKSELDKAKQELLDKNNANYYKLLEQEAYTFIKERSPVLFAEFQGKSSKRVLRIAAQFLLSLTLGKSYDEALNDAKNPNLSDQSARTSEEELPIAKALGDILFNSINNDDKRILKTIVEANPPADSTNLEDLYLENILKKYIHILLCRRAGRECTPKKREGGKKTDVAGDKKAEDKKPAPTPEGPDKKILEAIEKANEKLQNALYSLKKAKQFLGNLKAPERAIVKSSIQKALSANDSLKAAAEAIVVRYGQNMPTQYAKFVQIVQEIYKEAGGF